MCNQSELLLHALFYCMSCRRFKVILCNSQIDLGIKTTQRFGCDNAVFEFKKEFLLIHCGWRKAHSLHSCLEPLCMRICMTKLVYWLALMCNTLRFAISQ